MTKFRGSVALVTGAARGQGRSHAVSLAQQGAAIVAVDLCADVDTIPYTGPRPADLAETQRLVEEAGSECIPVQADVRDSAKMLDAVGIAVDKFGRIDICIANAGVVSFGSLSTLTDKEWSTMIDVNLTGVFNTVRAVVPSMVARGYGRIITISSMSGRSGTANLAHYAAAKWGVIGLTKTLALEVAGTGVTANTVCPGTVSTEMVHNAAMYGLFAPELTEPSKNDVRHRYAKMNPMGVPWSSVEDITSAVLYLASDAARHISGITLEIGSGVSARMS